MSNFFPWFTPVPQQRTVTIMLDPAGDAQYTGRKIDDTFERGLTMQYTEKLKQLLENRYTYVKVILTRFPGERIAPLQNANFANRLAVDLYISINFYHEHETKPRLYLYNFSYNDDFITKKNEWAFSRYDQAHLFNYHKTHDYGATMTKILRTEPYAKLFDCKGMFKLPCKQLLGIKSPAILVEAGLINTDHWISYIEPLADSLQPIIEQVRHA